MPPRPQSSAGLVLARLMLASVFITMGAWRLWQAWNGVPTSGATLSFSAGELVLGLLLAAGWRLPVIALLSALLMLVDAAMSHKFWALAEPARSGQLLHFMKNIAIAGGFLLLALTAPGRRR